MSGPLTAIGLDYAYPSRGRVLRGVGFSVRPGEAVAVIGPSGAGKSTLLRLLARLARPNAGRVTLGDVDLHDTSQSHALRGAIGYVHQQHGLPATVSVAMAVLGGRMHAWSPAKVFAAAAIGPTNTEIERVGAVLRRVGLEGREFDHIGELSVGQRQRVAIARTLLQAPQLIVADEPVASVDPTTADNVLRLLAGEAERGAIVLCSVHDVDKACRHFRRVIALREGTLVYDGAHDDLTAAHVAEVYDGCLA
ncbi:MAG: phosphonate ABC transporter ATP-binding protein [Coriobacteriia bacterium]